MPTFTRDTTDPARVTDTCQRCGTPITHLKGDRAHLVAMQAHQCKEVRR